MAQLIAAAKAVPMLMRIPYRAGAGGIDGADCWGMVELWYRLVLGIEVTDRASHPPGHDGLQAGFEAAQCWRAIDEPVDHCLVTMRAKGLEAGHVGIHLSGMLLHTDERHGCVFEPLSGRFIRSRISGYLEHL